MNSFHALAFFIFTQVHSEDTKVNFIQLHSALMKISCFPFLNIFLFLVPYLRGVLCECRQYIERNHSILQPRYHRRKSWDYFSKSRSHTEVDINKQINDERKKKEQSIFEAKKDAKTFLIATSAFNLNFLSFPFFSSRNEIFEFLKAFATSSKDVEELRELLDLLGTAEMRHIDFLIYLMGYYKHAHLTFLKAIMEILTEHETTVKNLIHNLGWNCACLYSRATFIFIFLKSFFILNITATQLYAIFNKNTDLIPILTDCFSCMCCLF